MERNRARNPRIFDTVLRDTETSDLDVLVDPVPGATLLDLGGLQALLEELLGVQVDLWSPADLPKRARDRVLGVLPAGVRDWRRPGLIAFLPRLIRAIGGTYGQQRERAAAGPGPTAATAG